MDDQKFNELLPLLETIALDTKLRISIVKEFKIIKAIHKRIGEEQKRNKPGIDIIDKQNVHSLYLTIRQFNVLNTTS